ncbi:MAG: TlpA disulfide reductase family protein, partial [Ginsengibacter sp.]
MKILFQVGLYFSSFIYGNPPTSLMANSYSFNSEMPKEKNCQISGTIHSEGTKSIILIKPGQDWRFDPVIEIPVVDGKFYYKTKLDYPQAVQLFLGEVKEKGGGRYMNLFLENEKMELEIFSENEFEKNKVKGGKLNAEYARFKSEAEKIFGTRKNLLSDSLTILQKNKQYHSEEMNEVLDKINKSESQDEKIIYYKKMDNMRNAKRDKMPEAKRLSDKMEAVFIEEKAFQQNYINDHPTLVSYSFFIQNLIFQKKHVDPINARITYKKLAGNNRNHPYNTLALDLLDAIDNIKVGGQFTDFEAPDLNGQLVKLSNKIKGKIDLLDLWASWCGPCIARTKTMLPLYDEYKDKGLTIVGVAGEFKNTKNLLTFLEREKWPWLQLLELDRQNNIWQKYGVDNAGGAMF